MDRQQELEQLEKLVEDVQAKIDKDMFDDWIANPCTQRVMLDIQIRVILKEMYLEEGAFLNEDKPLENAAAAVASKLAFKDILNTTYEEMSDEG